MPANGGTPVLTQTFTLDGFHDTEGVASIAGRTVVITEERRAALVTVDLPAFGGTVHKSSGVTCNLIYPPGQSGANGNSGIEGVAYAAAEGAYYAVQEKDPKAFLRIDPTTCSVTVPFDAEDRLGTLDDLAGLTYLPEIDAFFILSHASLTVAQVTRAGDVIATLPIGGSQPEGIAFNADRSRLYVLSEPNHVLTYVSTQQCDEASWPDKDGGLVCGECKVLVDNFNSIYGSCDGYCAAIGRSCTGAWEESGDTCTVKHDMACDQSIASSDAICECAALAPLSPPTPASPSPPPPSTLAAPSPPPPSALPSPPPPSAQCECSLVPCGQCQEGCEPELCGEDMATGNSWSRNGCATVDGILNMGHAPAFCQYPPNQTSPLPAKGHAAWVYDARGVEPEQAGAWADNIASYNDEAAACTGISTVFSYGGSMEWYDNLDPPGKTYLPTASLIAAQRYAEAHGVRSVMLVIDGQMGGGQPWAPDLSVRSDAELLQWADDTAATYCAHDVVGGVQLDLEPLSSQYLPSFLIFAARLSANLRSGGCISTYHPTGRPLAVFGAAEAATREMWRALGPNGFFVASGYDLGGGTAGTAAAPVDYAAHLSAAVDSIVETSAKAEGRFMVTVKKDTPSCRAEMLS